MGRRMIDSKVVNGDDFIGLNATAQALYLQLCMTCDDDGLTKEISTAMFRSHASQDDLKSLIESKFIHKFESGVVVILHWKMQNTIKSDRYKPSIFKEEFDQLTLDGNIYKIGTALEPLWNQNGTGLEPDWNQTGSEMEPKWNQNGTVSKDKLSKDKLSNNNNPKSGKEKHIYGEHKNVLLTDDEYKKLQERFPFNYQDKIEELSEGLALHGYKYKSHYLAILKWNNNKKAEPVPKQNKFNNFNQRDYDWDELERRLLQDGNE